LGWGNLHRSTRPFIAGNNSLCITRNGSRRMPTLDATPESGSGECHYMVNERPTALHAAGVVGRVHDAVCFTPVVAR
jgi:hypothetical protein